MLVRSLPAQVRLTQPHYGHDENYGYEPDPDKGLLLCLQPR